jgi:hypothetical protein
MVKLLYHFNADVADRGLRKIYFIRIFLSERQDILSIPVHENKLVTVPLQIYT